MFRCRAFGSILWFFGLVACATGVLAPAGEARAELKPAPPPRVCVGEPARCSASAGAEAPTTVKWNPGHYMISNSIGSVPADHFTALSNEPLLKGIRQRYWWAALEPSKGAYDFSLIDADLARLEGMNKRLVITVADRSWSGTSAAGKLPAYLASDPVYSGGWFVKPDDMGVIARLWDPTVMERVIALYAALAARYDGHPNVEGVVLGETSPGFNASPSGYSRGTLAAQLKRQITAVRKSWPKSNVFMYTNSLVGELQAIVEHAYQQQAGVGGPDVLAPPHKGIAGDRIVMGIEPGAVRDYRGLTPIGYEVQSPELCGKEGCFLPSVLRDYAVGTLRATHLFWVKMGTEKDTATAKYSWQYGIVPAIRATNGKINTACPANYGGRCATR